MVSIVNVTYTSENTCTVKIIGFDHKEKTMIMPLSLIDFTHKYNSMFNKENRILIQDALPELNPDQREFLISGTTPEEWEELFG